MIWSLPKSGLSAFSVKEKIRVSGKNGRAGKRETENWEKMREERED